MHGLPQYRVALERTGLDMKKVIALVLLFSIIAMPAYALSLLDMIIYNEVQLGNERVLVNRFTGKVERILKNSKYVPISSRKGWGGIPSAQDMYQAQYNKIR